jgi:dsDNA-binding SOS-regulon protein
MDPIEAFNRMMESAESSQWDEAVEHAENLIEWLDKGGFAPMFRVSADDRLQFLLADETAMRLSRSLCNDILVRGKQTALRDAPAAPVDRSFDE